MDRGQLCFDCVHGRGQLLGSGHLVLPAVRRSQAPDFRRERTAERGVLECDAGVATTEGREWLGAVDGRFWCWRAQALCSAYRLGPRSRRRATTSGCRGRWPTWQPTPRERCTCSGSKASRCSMGRSTPAWSWASKRWGPFPTRCSAGHALRCAPTAAASTRSGTPPVQRRMTQSCTPGVRATEAGSKKRSGGTRPTTRTGGRPWPSIRARPCSSWPAGPLERTHARVNRASPARASPRAARSRPWRGSRPTTARTTTTWSWPPTRRGAFMVAGPSPAAATCPSTYATCMRSPEAI